MDEPKATDRQEHPRRGPDKWPTADIPPSHEAKTELKKTMSKEAGRAADRKHRALTRKPSEKQYTGCISQQPVLVRQLVGQKETKRGRGRGSVPAKAAARSGCARPHRLHLTSSLSWSCPGKPGRRPPFPAASSPKQRRMLPPTLAQCLDPPPSP